MKLKRKLASFVVAGIMAVMSCVSLASSAARHLRYDADGNGEVGLADAVYVSQYLGGAFEPENLDLCDVDRNGVVSEMDVNKIQRYCIGLMYDNYLVDDNVNNAHTVNSEVKYRVYNAKTGKRIRNRDDYTLSKLGSSDKARAVIGDSDDRVIDWSKSGVVKIITNYDKEYYGLSSGFVVGDHVIATAAHCLYDYTNAEPKSVSKILLFNSDGEEVANVTPVEYHLPVDFINAVNEKHKYVDKSDYALITVKEDLRDYNNFNLGVPLKSFDNSNSVVKVTGFPGDIGKPGEEVEVNNDLKHFMYTGSGKVYSGDDTHITYTADMTPGDSGGPVYLTESYNGDTYYTVVGINIACPDVEKPLYNIGTRMTTDLIHFYTNNNPNIKW